MSGDISINEILKKRKEIEERQKLLEDKDPFKIAKGFVAYMLSVTASNTFLDNIGKNISIIKNVYDKGKCLVVDADSMEIDSDSFIMCRAKALEYLGSIVDDTEVRAHLILSTVSFYSYTLSKIGANKQAMFGIANLCGTYVSRILPSNFSHNLTLPELYSQIAQTGGDIDKVTAVVSRINKHQLIDFILTLFLETSVHTVMEIVTKGADEVINKIGEDPQVKVVEIKSKKDIEELMSTLEGLFDSKDKE